MHSSVNYKIYSVVLQPTTLCNLNCSYCYLPAKDKNLKMLPEVTESLAVQIKKSKQPVNLIWHAGEPLTIGLKYFKNLIKPFKDCEAITHVIQTNATLINKDWCDFFKEYNFQIGVSIDGPEWANWNRVSLTGKSVFNKIVKGINVLKKNKLEFIVICVVNSFALRNAKELYNFFCELGCQWVGINIEEKEGVNKRDVCDDERVLHFWEELFVAWRENPKIEIREFSTTLNWFNNIINDKKFNFENYSIDLFPSIDYSGNIVLLSPELLGGLSKKYSNFVVGNVKSNSIYDIENIAENSINYVQDFTTGILRCKEECEYFSYCKGGQASNKFYEHGSLDITETIYCRNGIQRPVDAIIRQLKLEENDNFREKN